MRATFLTVILLFTTAITFTQDLHLMVGDKTIRSYSVDDGINYILADENKNDTIKTQLVYGIIEVISFDELTLNYFNVQTNYFYNDVMLNKYEEYSNNFSDEFPVENITHISVTPKSKDIGGIISAVGGVAFLLAPFISMNFKDFGDFKVDRYLTVAGAGLGLISLGIVVQLPGKRKIYEVKESTLCESCYKKYKIIKNAKIVIE